MAGITLYAPVQKLLDVHNWKRPNAADGMHQASNVFDPNWNTAAGKNYLEGIMSLAAAYFVIGALCTLAYIILNSLACCCRRKPGKERAAAGCCSNFCGCLFSARGWYIGAVVVVAAVTAAGMSQMTSFKSTVDTTVSGVDSLNYLLTNAGGLASNNLTANLGALDTSLTDLSTQAAAAGVPAADQTAIADALSAAQAAKNSAVTMGAQLSSAASSLFSQLRSGKLDLHALGKQVFAGGIAALALYFGYLLLSTLTLIPSKCCACTFRVCNVVLIGVFLLTWVFAGIFLTVSVVGADVCVDPSTAIGKVINGTGNTILDPSAADTLVYYTSCLRPDGTVVPPTTGAAAQLAAGQASFATAQSNFQSTYASLSASYPALVPTLDAVNGSFAAAGATLASVATTASCTAVYSIYNSFITSLCNTGIVGVINVWALATAACILMFLIATSAARLCWRHPGDEPTAKGDAGDVAAAGRGSHHANVGPAPTYIAMSPNPPAVGPATGSAAAYAGPAGAPNWR